MEIKNLSREELMEVFEQAEQLAGDRVAVEKLLGFDPDAHRNELEEALRGRLGLSDDEIVARIDRAVRICRLGTDPEHE